MTIGKVGSGQYFCWDCCVEFSVGRNGFQIYRVEEDGTLIQERPGQGPTNSVILPAKEVTH